MNGTGIEAHNSLGIRERYHQPLRQKYRKIKSEHPQVLPEVALAASVKALNDTLRPESIVKSALVLGEYPRMFISSATPAERRTIAERASVPQSARKEMARIMVEM